MLLGDQQRRGLHVIGPMAVRFTHFRLRRCCELTNVSSRDDDTSLEKGTLKYYTDLAKLAERGKVSSIFFADWFVGFDVYGGGLDTMLRAGHQVAHLDPSMPVSAMAAVTKSLAFAVTQSTTYANPYVLARQMSSLVRRLLRKYKAFPADTGRTISLAEGWHGTSSPVTRRAVRTHLAMRPSCRMTSATPRLTSSWMSSTSKHLSSITCDTSTDISDCGSHLGRLAL